MYQSGEAPALIIKRHLTHLFEETDMYRYRCSCLISGKSYEKTVDALAAMQAIVIFMAYIDDQGAVFDYLSDLSIAKVELND